jgi:hypothetical protein
MGVVERFDGEHRPGPAVRLDGSGRGQRPPGRSGEPGRGTQRDPDDRLATDQAGVKVLLVALPISGQVEIRRRLEPLVPYSKAENLVDPIGTRPGPGDDVPVARLEHQAVRTDFLDETSEWEDFPAVNYASRHYGGGANFEEIDFPTKGFTGLTLRLFDITLLVQVEGSLRQIFRQRKRREPPNRSGRIEETIASAPGEESGNGGIPSRTSSHRSTVSAAGSACSKAAKYRRSRRCSSSLGSAGGPRPRRPTPPRFAAIQCG